MIINAILIYYRLFYFIALFSPCKNIVYNTAPKGVKPQNLQ